MSEALQQTLAGNFTLSGIGIHTGERVCVTVHPAQEDFGRMFRIGKTEIPARADYVIDTSRCTVLGLEETRISTVEHLLSALSGCNIDNALIEVTGSELPILDGSSLPWVEAIQSAGVCIQQRAAHTFRIQERIEIVQGQSVIEAIPADEYSLEVTTQFDHWPEGNTTLIVSPNDDTNSYTRQIAPARTFAFLHEVQAILDAGLAKGGSLENVLIITPPATFSSPLRVEHEWCAHKLLDCMGDLALLNARPCFQIRAVRPGHRINNAMARELLSRSEQPSE